MGEALHHGTDVGLGAGKGNLVHENGAIGASGAAIPFENVGAAGVVIGQGEREGVVGLRVAFEKFLEIPSASEGVGGGIEEGVGGVAGDVFGVGPFAGGDGADLHEAIFTRATALAGMETAFAPDDGLYQRRFEAVALGGGEDGNVLAVVAPFVPPPITAGSGEKQEEKEKETAVHGMVVPEARGGGQAGECGSCVDFWRNRPSLALILRHGGFSFESSDIITFMASRNARVSQNVSGKFYVDSSCIYCGLCVTKQHRAFSGNVMKRGGHMFSNSPKPSKNYANAWRRLEVVRRSPLVKMVMQARI